MPTPDPSDRSSLTEQLAVTVEHDRASRADEVETQRVDLAAEVEITRSELAAILEQDRKLHNIRMERRLKERTQVINRRFAFLFLAIVLIFGLLAYRTEVNANDLRDGFYEACQVRAQRQVQANVGRETLVQLAANGPTSPTDPTAKVLLVQQLRDALLLPVEDCGPAAS